MTLKVALFRARDDAAASAARLRRLGFSVARLSATEIAPLSVAPARAHYDAVLATSANAFLGDGPSDRTPPLYVVGARTGRAAKARGWRLASPPAPDAAGLIETLERGLPPRARLLYLAGHDRKDAVEAGLGGRYDLEVVEAYAAEARAVWRPAEIRALESCTAALHYSRRSSALAARLAEASGLAAHFRAMRHFCLSRDVAEPIEALGAARVAVAAAPDETTLLATLARSLRGFPSLGASRI